MGTDASWEARSRAVWAEIDRLEPADFRARIDALSAELPVGDPVASFERGAAFDSTGHPDRAVPLYRAALDAGVDAGLDPERRRRAVIQMASSIRNLGDPQQALDLLEAEAARPSDPLDAAVTTFPRAGAGRPGTRARGPVPGVDRAREDAAALQPLGRTLRGRAARGRTRRGLTAGVRCRRATIRGSHGRENPGRYPLLRRIPRCRNASSPTHANAPSPPVHRASDALRRRPSARPCSLRGAWAA